MAGDRTEREVKGKQPSGYENRRHQGKDARELASGVHRPRAGLRLLAVFLCSILLLLRMHMAEALSSV